MAYCKRVVDDKIAPFIKGAVDTLNKHLAKKNLRAGLEIKWFFDSTEQGDYYDED